MNIKEKQLLIEAKQTQRFLAGMARINLGRYMGFVFSVPHKRGHLGSVYGGSISEGLVEAILKYRAKGEVIKVTLSISGNNPLNVPKLNTTTVLPILDTNLKPMKQGTAFANATCGTLFRNALKAAGDKNIKN